MQAGILYWLTKWKKEEVKKYTDKVPDWGNGDYKGITRHVWNLVFHREIPKELHSCTSILCSYSFSFSFQILCKLLWYTKLHDVLVRKITPSYNSFVKTEVLYNCLEFFWRMSALHFNINDIEPI